jgi:ABC-type glycerol-3-phosphate transport system substrate-binding protein
VTRPRIQRTLRPRPGQGNIITLVAGLVATIALVAGVAVAAARPAQQPTKSAPVTIRLLACCAEVISAPLIKAFEAANPGIQVTQEVVPFPQLNDVVLQRIGSKDPSIDVYWADQPRTAALAARGLLLDLTNTWGRAARGTIFRPSIAASTWKGKVWSAPWATSTQLLYYNKALLAKAHITPPAANPAKRWTREQLLQAASAAKRAGAKCGFMFDQVDLYYQLQPLPVSAGGGTGLKGPNNLTPDITNPGWVKAMNYYAKLFSSGVAPRGIDPAQTPSLFSNGQCAFWEGGPWHVGEFLAAKNLDWGIAPIPAFAGGKPVTPTDSLGLGVNPYSQHKAETIKFIEFATLTATGDLNAVGGSGNVPANIRAAAHYYTTLTRGHPNLKRLGTLISYEIAKTSVHRPASVGYIDFETIMNRAFSDIRNGKNVVSTLNRAQRELKDAFSRYS